MFSGHDLKVCQGPMSEWRQFINGTHEQYQQSTEGSSRDYNMFFVM